MSIANLQDFVFPAINTTNLNVTVDAMIGRDLTVVRDVNIGRDLGVTGDVLVGGDITANNIAAIDTITADRASIADELRVDTINTFTTGAVLQIGNDAVQTGSIELGAATKEIKVLGSLKANTLDSFTNGSSIAIGGELTSGNVELGHIGINTEVIGSFVLPSVGAAPSLLINDSYAEGSYISSCTGARVDPSAANIRYYKINSFVYLDITSLLANSPALADAGILLSTPLPVELRPAVPKRLTGTVFDNTNPVPGAFLVNINGTIDIGVFDTGDFSVTQDCNIISTSIFYSIV